MRGIKINPYQAQAYPLPLGFNGRWAWLYRWFSGRPLNGHRYTDATGFRYGTMALDPSGKASSYHLLPGVLRFLYFRAPVMLAIPFALAWLLWPLAMYLATLGLAIVATWRVQRWRARQAFRRDVTEPVAAAVATVLRARRVDGQGHKSVAIPADFRDNPDARVAIKLPLDWVGQDGDKAALVAAVSAKLAMDELTATWSLHGGQPTVTLAVPPKPPDMVDWLEARAKAEAVPDGEVMVGVGVRDKIETFSLLLESPHALINGGSGAGKSVLLAWVVAQLMRRGYGVMVLDAKFVSHLWLKRIPGVHYTSEAQELHEALIWLDQELLRRARLVSSAADMEAAIRKLVPLVAVLEEINSATNRLRAYWKSIKGPDDPVMSPALTALANLANMGRQMRVNIFMAGQSITAKSVGGPEGRESFGGRMLARATANAWRMLAPQIKPAPVKRNKPGRWHLVVGDTLREFQVPFVDLEDLATAAALIEWATGGLPVPDVTAMILGQDQVVVDDVAETPSSGPTTCTLPEYDQARRVGLKRLENWRSQDREAFPEAAGRRGKAYAYTWEALDAYVAQRLREPVE